MRRPSAFPRSKPGPSDIFEKRSLAGGGEIANDHVRDLSGSKMWGEGIPHSAMPGKFLPRRCLDVSHMRACVRGYLRDPHHVSTDLLVLLTARNNLEYRYTNIRFFAPGLSALSAMAGKIYLS